MSRPWSSRPATSSRRASSIPTATRTARCSSTARSSATFARASRPSCRATAGTRSRRWRAPSAPMLDADLAHLGLDPAWTTFADYLDEVEQQPMGPNVALLVGHGTVRWAAMGPDGRAPTPDELAAMGRYVEEALDAGAIGLSSGLIYAPGVHAAPDEVAALVAVAARRGGLYATHMRNESAGVLDSLDEAISTTRAAGDSPDARHASRSRTSRRAPTPSGARRTRWSSGSMLPGATASTLPPTSIHTRRPRPPCRRSCPPRSSPCPSPTPRRRSGTRPRERPSAT